MLLENIPLILIIIFMLVLVYALSDSWLMLIILTFFSIALANQATPSITSVTDGYQVQFLAVAVPLYAVANLIDLISQRRKGSVPKDDY